MPLINTYRRGIATRAPVIPVQPAPPPIVNPPVPLTYPQEFSASFSSDFS